MSFKKYPKIHRLGKDETLGILEGEVHVQEKVDGANASIWIEDGIVQCGSRSRHLENEGFNGFVPYAQSHIGIKDLLTEHSEYRLYGEWLVRHTISYDETAYKQFYLFDIAIIESDIEEAEVFLPIVDIYNIAKKYNIKIPTYHGLFENPTEESLKEFIGVSSIGEKGEGIVLKNDTFLNVFGDNVYAKIVTDNFKENNAIVFGGNNKHSDTYWEVYTVNKYITLARVQKIMHKIQPTEDDPLDLKHTPRIINTVYHDMITEEMWEIQKKVQTINFKKLKQIACKKAVKIYHDILKNEISVAYEKSNNS